MGVTIAKKDISINPLEGIERGFYATWTKTHKNSSGFSVQWQYKAQGTEVYFDGQTNTAKYNGGNGRDTYSAPANATAVRVRVKLISEKKKSGGNHFTASWSDYVYATITPPVPLTTAPSTPEVRIENGQLIAMSTSAIGEPDVGGVFEVIANDNALIASIPKQFSFSSATVYQSVYVGNRYKVRAGTTNSENITTWSEYSKNISPPPPQTSITSLAAIDPPGSSVRVAWAKAETATKYEIQYATNLDYFDKSDRVTTVNVDSELTTYDIYDLTPGSKYYFRVRGINETGEAPWSEITNEFILGTKPGIPTTWSLPANSAKRTESINLYFTHNSTDGSRLTEGKVSYKYDNGQIQSSGPSNSFNQYEPEGTYVCTLPPSPPNASTLTWYVQTAGITRELSEKSIERVISIYDPPTLSIGVDGYTPDMQDDHGNLMITHYPLNIQLSSGPRLQKPVGYYVSIVAKDSYDSIDNLGNPIWITSGQELYSYYVNSESYEIEIPITPDLITLSNQQIYTIRAKVAMSSGLYGEVSMNFVTNFDTSSLYYPNMASVIDPELVTLSMHVYCSDDEGNEVTPENVRLSVYRREFDGTFTLLAENLDPNVNTNILDKHPALDYARYRLIAMDITNGQMLYEDLEEEIGETSIIIQWNDRNLADEPIAYNPETLDFSVNTNNVTMLKLPYNIDISDNSNQDVSLINYIGRSYPVSYYGTQKGFTSTWNAVIPKTEVELLAKLRALSVWMGDVYVREPYGSGYWANVKVSFSQKHRELTIPVTINITRVEGGK